MPREYQEDATLEFLRVERRAWEAYEEATGEARRAYAAAFFNGSEEASRSMKESVVGLKGIAARFDRLYGQMGTIYDAYAASVRPARDAFESACNAALAPYRSSLPPFPVTAAGERPRFLPRTDAPPDVSRLVRGSQDVRANDVSGFVLIVGTVISTIAMGIWILPESGPVSTALLLGIAAVMAAMQYFQSTVRSEDDTLYVLMPRRGNGPVSVVPTGEKVLVNPLTRLAVGVSISKTTVMLRGPVATADGVSLQLHGFVAFTVRRDAASLKAYGEFIIRNQEWEPKDGLQALSKQAAALVVGRTGHAELLGRALTVDTTTVTREIESRLESLGLSMDLNLAVWLEENGTAPQRR